MTAKEFYEPLYKLLENVTPLKKDCGVLCDGICCKDGEEESGMLLFPGEEQLFSDCGFAKVLESSCEYGETGTAKLLICKGECDRTKRPLMAKAAAKYADKLIVTSDNPRDEEPDAIIADGLEGLAESGVPYEAVTDRREAIFHAVKTAQKGDVIVLAGKGHEDYQIFENNRTVHFDEREIVADALNTLA